MPEDSNTPGLKFLGRLSSAAGRVEHAAARIVRAMREHHVWRRIGLGFAMVAVSLAGASLGLLLGGRAHHDVGPFSAQFQVTPSLSGGTDVQIPPLGSLTLRSHDGPAHLTVRLGNLDQQRTLALANDPNGLAKVSEGAVTDVKEGVTKLVLQAAGAALLGTLALSWLVFRDSRRVAFCGGLTMVTLVASGAVAIGTFRPNSVEEPRYQGLLTNAPAVVGDARKIAGDFTAYRAELQRLVNNVTRLYTTFSTLPVYEPDPGTVRVLHISDLHLNPSAWSVIQTVAKEFDVNFVVDTGDIDDWGTQVESSYVDSIGTLKVPYVFVSGNHDSTVTTDAVARQANARVLQNGVITLDGLTIAGIGDPLFTPDKAGQPVGDRQQELLLGAGTKLANTIQGYGKPVDMALVHDPAMAPPLAGTVPLILAGHIHRRDVRTLDPETTTPTPAYPASLEMVEGSTGGAGLRGLEGEQPTPLEMSVLYFDQKHALQAYDDITLGGTGQAEVTLERHVVGDSTPAVGVSPSASPG